MVLFKFADTFFSFFMSRPLMDEQAAVLLNKNSVTLTAMFLLALCGLGTKFCQSNPNPTLFLSQISIMQVMLICERKKVGSGLDWQNLVPHPHRERRNIAVNVTEFLFSRTAACSSIRGQDIKNEKKVSANLNKTILRT